MKFSSRHSGLLLAAALLTSCAGGGEFGPTIGDLDEPISFESIGKLDGFHMEVEPEVTFEIDRQQVIASFRELVAITAEGGGTGDELRRLADLELEASLDKQLADDEVTQAQGVAEARHAIGIYEGYLEKYPDRINNDMILYQLSRAYAIEGTTDESLATLDRIAFEFPHSQYIDEVQFRRGEILFVDGDFASAEQAYGTIVEFYPDSLFYEKALYKYGWSQFKQDRFGESLASFTQLLDINLENNKVQEIDFNPVLTRGELELLEDVVRVVSLAFAYQEEDLYISEHFARAGKRDYEPLLYRKLGEMYLQRDRLIDSSKLFLTYAREYPFSPHTPYFHERAIEVYQQAGYSDLVLEQKIAFVDRYDVGTDYWSLQDEQTRQKVAPILVTHLGDLATHYHAAARKTKKTGDYEIAANWYRRNLKSFPDDPGASRVNFLLAESLYDARRYPQAVDEYEKTAYGYPRHPDAAEAGYAALVSFDAMFETTNASDIPALRRKRIQSAVRFTTTFPDDPRLSAVEVQTANQFYAWKEYDQVMDSAQRLIDNPNVERKTKETAWTLLSDSQFATADYAGAEKSYVALLGFLPAQGKERQEVREQVAASIYKQGEAARDAGDHLLAASHFSRLGQVVPESPTRIVADYDAATAYVQLEDWPATIQSLEDFRKRYPNDKRFTTGITEKLALAYSNSGNQSGAAREMLALSNMPGSAERKRDLMWRAAELYEETGQQDQAVGVYKKYVAAYPTQLARSIELRYKISEY